MVKREEKNKSVLFKMAVTIDVLFVSSKYLYILIKVIFFGCFGRFLKTKVAVQIAKYFDISDN